MNKLKYILPPLVILLGLVVAVTMVRSRKAAETHAAEIPPPLVRVMTARVQDYRFTVNSQGTVEARTDITLVSEVSGRVVSVSPALAAGGFFDQGEVLATLEALDYEAAAERARAEVKRAELRLAQEEAQADMARREWERLGEGDATPLTLRELQVAEATATAASARAALKQAERDLERTRIRAPFTGRVRVKNVDAGQYLSRGAAVAQIYAVDYAEVRLPLPDADAAFVDLPLDYRDRRAATSPEVFLNATFAGETHRWTGRIVRTEGEIDPKSRMLYAVARVEDPYGRNGSAGGPPLAVGLFVDADILGRNVENVVVIPRSAVRGRNQVLLVDAEDRLHPREVEILRTEGEDVIVGSGIAEGESVCLTPLDAVVDGMKVRTLRPDPENPEIKTGGVSS